MSINPTTNYMSNEYILTWMEQKTEGIYGKMRTAMDSSNHRADAEEALNGLKSKIADASANHTDGALLRDDIEELIKTYGREFPEVTTTLQPVLKELNDRYQRNVDAARAPLAWNPDFYDPNARPAPVDVSKDDADRWGKAIGNQVESYGKTDQLGMVNIQELNAQLNQAKQTASALMDASDKSTNTIINHIA